MERAELLLLVLCLQVFLLISSFTSADGAALTRDEEYSPVGVERGNTRYQRVFGNRGRVWRKCRRDGLCVRFGGDFDIHPPPPPRPDSGERMDEMEGGVEELRGNYRPRGPTNCSGRAGGCGVLPMLPKPENPPPGPDSSSSDGRDWVEMEGRGFRGYPRPTRLTSNCSWMPGACGQPGHTG